MENNERDEIIEELWEVKDNLSSSCDQNVGEIIQKMNMIADRLGFEGEIDLGIDLNTFRR